MEQSNSYLRSETILNIVNNPEYLERNESITDSSSDSDIPMVHESQRLLLEHPEEVSLTPKKKRKYWIDALRVVSNFMVVMVHSSSYAINDITPLSKEWTNLMFWDALNRACVPLFIMISGVLLLDPTKSIPLSKLYKKYIFRIVKDLLFWNFIYATFGKFYINGFELTWENFRADFLYDMICGKFHLWYLYMYLGIYILTPLFRVIAHNTECLIYFLIISVSFCQVLPFIVTLFKVFYPNELIDNLDEALSKLMLFMITGYIIYYPMGYFLNRVELKNRFTLFLLYSTSFVALLSTYIIKMVASRLNGKEIYDFGDYNALNVSLTAVGTFLFFKHTGSKFLRLFLSSKKFKNVLLQLSDLTYGIYLIHIGYFELFYYYGFHSYTLNPLFFTPIHAFCVWICSAVTAFLLKKVPIIKNFI